MSSKSLLDKVAELWRGVIRNSSEEAERTGIGPLPHLWIKGPVIGRGQTVRSSVYARLWRCDACGLTYETHVEDVPPPLGDGMTCNEILTIRDVMES